MATTPLTELMDEMAAIIADAVGVGEGLGVEQVEGRRIYNPTPPCVDIYPAEQFRTFDAGGFGEITGAYIFTVRARANTADNEAGQDVLLAMMDDEHDFSIANALFDDQTLNGLATSVRVDGPTGFREYVDIGGQGFLGVEWTVTVLRALS